MSETAALWVEHLLPPVAYRQWLLSLPASMAVRLGYNAAILGRVRRSFARRVSQSLRRRVKRRHPLDTVRRTGASTGCSIHQPIIDDVADDVRGVV